MSRRKTATTNRTLVYEYGCGQPIQGEEALDQEMFLRNQLWNQLVAIENPARQKYDSIVRTELDDQIEALQTLLADLCTLLKKEKADAAYLTILIGKARSMAEQYIRLNRRMIDGQTSTDEITEKDYKSVPFLLFDDAFSIGTLKEAIKQVRKDLKPLFEEAKAKRKERSVTYAEDLALLEEQRAADTTESKKGSPLYWCNKDEVFDQYFNSRKAAMKIHADLHFHSFKHTGKITVRRSAGFTPEELFGATSSQISIAPVPKSAWDKSLGRRRKKLQWTTLKMNIGRDNSVFEIPVCLHRPIPEDAKILSASIIKRDLGLKIVDDKVLPRKFYRLTLSLSLPAAKPAKTTKAPVTVWFCSKLNEDHGLVAGVAATAKTTKEIVLPESLTSKFKLVDNLKARRDEYQNQAQSAINQLAQRTSLPAWFKEASAFVEKWKSPQRYLSLYPLWKSKRFKGDDIAFHALEVFRERYIHLFSWEDHTRSKAANHRREIYRTFAADLVKNGRQIWLDKSPEIPTIKAETETQEMTNKRYWRKAAACYTLWTSIKNAATREGVELVHLDREEISEEAAA